MLPEYDRGIIAMRKRSVKEIAEYLQADCKGKPVLKKYLTVKIHSVAEELYARSDNSLYLYFTFLQEKEKEWVETGYSDGLFVYSLVMKYIDRSIVEKDFDKAPLLQNFLDTHFDAGVSALAMEQKFSLEPKKKPDIYYIKGSTVSFGRYIQSEIESSRPEPIEWTVLEHDPVRRKSLLLSRYELDTQPYDDNGDTYWDVDISTWEKSTIRSWLNKEFLNGAFTAEEQGTILTTDVDNSSGQCFDFPWWSKRYEEDIAVAEKTFGGNDTQDKIFLLSYAEANKYLNVTDTNRKNTKSRISPTPFAKARGADIWESVTTVDGAAAGWWWLRSPGISQCHAARVVSDGSLHYAYVNNTSGGIRPAFWLDLVLCASDH